MFKLNLKMLLTILFVITSCQNIEKTSVSNWQQKHDSQYKSKVSRHISSDSNDTDLYNEKIALGSSAEEVKSKSEIKTILEKGLYPNDLSKKAVWGNKKEVHLFFNMPPYTNPGNIGLIPALLRHINNAKTSIRMSIFQFNHKEVFEALKKAISERNIKVYISTDLLYRSKENYKEYFEDLESFMKEHGQDPVTQLVDDKTGQEGGVFNHNKYMIFDYESGDDAISWFGSFNPTNHGSVENVELAMTIKGKEAAEILKLDFDQQMSGIYKSAKRGVYLLDGKPILLNDKELFDLVDTSNESGQAINITYPKVTIKDKRGDLTFEMLLSPKVKSVGRIIEELYAAKKEIVFSSFAIADQMVISTLINKFKDPKQANPYNLFPILLLRHPQDIFGYVYRKNGLNDKDHSYLIWEKSKTEKTPPQDIKEAMLPTVNDLKDTNYGDDYITKNDTITNKYRYIYQKGESGGEILKVNVEGIFNNKVIEAENTLDRLTSANIKTYKLQTNGDLHNKIFIVDESVVIFGSHNFSQAAENQNDELTIILKSPLVGKFLKKEYYDKTKLFTIDNSLLPVINYNNPTVAISEIMPETSFKTDIGNKNVDMGEYIELYNFGDKQIVLMGMHLSNKYFPSNSSLIPSTTSNSFSGTLVGFLPNDKEGELGFPVYDHTKTIIQPKGFALVVGKHFNKKHYEETFKNQFKLLNKREATEKDFPTLLTFSEYYSRSIGSSSQGLKGNHKITLYGIDDFSVIDRFDYAPDLFYINPQTNEDNDKAFFASKKNFDLSVERRINNDSLKTNFSKRKNARRIVPFRYKNMLTFIFDEFYGSSTRYSDAKEWFIDTNEKFGTPGTIPSQFPQFESNSEIIELYDRTPQELRN